MTARFEKGTRKIDNSNDCGASRCEADENANRGKCEEVQKVRRGCVVME